MIFLVKLITVEIVKIQFELQMNSQFKGQKEDAIDVLRDRF